MIIGNFQQQDDGYTGNVRTFGFGADVRFTPNPAKTGNAPDFAVRVTSYDGSEFDIGAAWRKTSKAGKPYLSVKLDGPMLAEPVNCALTQQAEGSYALVWTRREAGAEAA
jgi:uncharacterized protein (DUF736 family)